MFFLRNNFLNVQRHLFKMVSTAVQTPLELRSHNRNEGSFLLPSFGACPGYLQTNMAMLPVDVANDFEEFCEKNESACPLIYRSKDGEVGAPLLADDSDIRTDISAYKIYENGEFTKPVPDLKFYPWSHMVSFYLGCSFSFDDKLIASGIKLDTSKNVSMYKTNIKCHSVNMFSSPMVVSMRPIPESQLNDAVRATIDADYAHGAPVHIGCLEDIGLSDHKAIDFGDACKIRVNEVPVFWACGVTSSVAITNAKLPVTFSHHPGCMFVTDIQSDGASKIRKTKIYPPPQVVCLDKQYKRYSIISEHAYSLLNKIETELKEDLNDRGIQHLVVEGDFHKACLSLSKRATAVGIVLGFPCLQDFIPCEENDGIAGAIHIAKALQHMNVPVTFFIDTHSEILKQTVLSCKSEGYLTEEITVAHVGAESCADEVLFESTGKPKFSHLIAIERASPSQNGKICTMKGRDISSYCDPLHVLFEKAISHPSVTTIGIGDGGNELGMGKVFDQVVANVSCGETIAARVSSDYLISCGVSNWAGFGLAAGLYIVRVCPVHERFQRNGIGSTCKVFANDFLLSDKKDEALHKYLDMKGFRDGITGKAEMTVDSLDYNKVHLPKLQACRNIAVE